MNSRGVASYPVVESDKGSPDPGGLLDVVVPIFGGSYGNSGPIVNGDIIPPPIEYHHPVYCNSYDTGDMSVEITAERTMGETTVV